MTKTFFDRLPSRRSSLTVLLAAMGFATTLACGLNDDDKDDNADDTADDSAALQPSGPAGVAPNGVAFPTGVQDWGVIGAAARSDGGGSLRVILGNATAVRAARAGQTSPWPDGSALSHLVWKPEVNPDDAATVGPGDFQAVTLMMKDSTKYAADGGWAYGVWMGPDLTPPAAADFDRACVNCHTQQVQDKDYVFTDPGQLPAAADVAGAVDAPNGVTFPSQILDWRVIGIANVRNADPAQATLRVLVGNPTAVEAARQGNTNPWPDGSRISHIQWNASSDPDTDRTLGAGVAVTQGSFRAITVMQRSSAQYGAKGNWDYGAWPTMTLTPPPTFNSQVCVDCHTSSVADRDMVFTRMAELPALLGGR